MRKSFPVASATAACMTEFSSDLTFGGVQRAASAAAWKNVYKISGQACHEHLLHDLEEVNVRH
jgi:hypothetical protein